MTVIDHVLIVEDLPSSAQWLAALMASHFPSASVDVVGRVADGMAWLNARAADEAPLCLIDLGLPDGSGVDLIGALIRRLPQAIVIVTTSFDDDQTVLSAMAAGAAGYILKDQEPEVIGDRIAAVTRGEIPMSPAISRRILETFRTHARFALATTDASLTIREVDVLRLIGRGLRTTEVAATLCLSEHTVGSYLKTIYRKLDINTRAEAAIEASRRGLI